MAGSGGFAISIAAVDNASKTLDGVNRRLAALSAPAERFNKALARFGDTSGLNRVAEGVTTLGRGAADAFRSLDRMASPLAAITGAASIAGIIELSRRWAEFGTQVGQVSYRLNTPVERLGTLRGAMRLVGGNAADLDSGLRGLSDTLSAAAWGRDPRAVQLFQQLNIATRDSHDNIRQAGEVLGDVAEKIKGLPADTQSRILSALGLNDSFLPMLKDGRKGLEDLQKTVERTGSAMTPAMVGHANAMNKAWQELGMTIEGVGNRLVDKYAPDVTAVVDRTAKWIENNQHLADSITEIGVALTALGSIQVSSFILRLFGFGAASATLSAAGTAALGGLAAHEGLSYVDPNDRLGSFVDRNVPGAAWLDDWSARHLGIGRTYKDQGGGSDQPIRRQFSSNVPSILKPLGPSNATATMQRAHDFFRSKGLNEEQTAGILANIAAESGFDSTKWGDNGTSYGLFQHHGDRLTALRSWARTATPSEQQQLEFAWQELNTSQSGVFDRLKRVNTAGQAGAIFSGFERPADGPGEAFRRGQAADQFVQGHVQVDVNLKNAPPGTTAKVTTQGAVSAPPPVIETPILAPY